MWSLWLAITVLSINIVGDLFNALVRHDYRAFAQRGRIEEGSNRIAAELQQLSGIAPVTVRSGQSYSVHWRLACPKFLRQTFQEFAAQSIPHSHWAKAYYDQQKHRGSSHHAALRALAYKWIRILFRCWQERTPTMKSATLNHYKKAARLCSHSLPNPPPTPRE
jgi:hypothetical protein